MQIGKQFVVSSRVDQYLNNQRTGLLWDLLANPADKDATHTQNLQQLVHDHPQSGLLHALLTYARDGENLQQAAVYYDPKVLYKLNKDIDALYTITESQLLTTNGQHPVTGYFHTHDTEHSDELLLAPWDTEDEEVENQAPHLFTPIDEPVYDEIADPASELPPLVPDAAYEAEQHPETDALHIDVNAPVIEQQQETVAEMQHLALPEPKTAAAETVPEPAKPIEEDTFDEIVSIDDINLAVQEYYAGIMDTETGTHQPSEFDDVYAQALKNEEAPAAPITEISAEPVEAPKEETVFRDRKVDLNDEAEKLILNNIAATDFFVFDEAFGDRKKTEEEVKAAEPQPEPFAAVEPAPVETQYVASHVFTDEPAPVAEEMQPVAKANSYENISKYHDEKMPYSFMWWLDKTRKEHSGIYQPFVEVKLDTTLSIKLAEPDELEQQYIENIFHLNTVEELEGTEQPPVEFDHKKKEDEIIERFIQEVPQIKPQSADKLDNENKAKKSSEDEDELVTETLAQIYTDQMLYPKAIATYKKLMLKFPEKSRYFAGQIEALQKK